MTRLSPGELDVVMVEFALNSHAIVDTGELRSLGLDSAAITRRLDRRRLFRLHRGVYSVIPPTHLKPEETLQLNTGKLADLDDVDLNKFERRFCALCRRYGIPKPLKQQIIGPFTVDFLWPDAGLVVETDGWKDHGTRERFEADRARDAWLMTRGYRVVRVTWRQLRDDPSTIAATLRRLILSS